MIACYQFLSKGWRQVHGAHGGLVTDGYGWYFELIWVPTYNMFVTCGAATN